MGGRTSRPRRTKEKDAPQQPEPDSEEDQPSEEEEQPLEDEVEWALSKEPTEVAPQSEESGASSDEDDDAEARLVQLCDEGGVLAINFLLSKAVSPTTMDIPTKSPKEWTYRDIARLPEAEQKEWRTACHNELDALKR